MISTTIFGRPINNGMASQENQVTEEKYEKSSVSLLDRIKNAFAKSKGFEQLK